MIKSGRKRNDFVSLLNLAGNLSQSSVSTSYSGNSQLTDDNVYQIMLQILQSSNFANKVQNIINNSPNYSTGGNLTVGDIYGNNAFFEYIQAELITADQIVANSGNFKDLSALVAMIDNLLAGTVSAELGHLIELTAQNVRIDEAVIRDLIAAEITVSMLKASDISTDKFNITSDDGGITIVGNTMQFRDKSGTVRIQIGRDETDNFTFVLYDESGTGVLIDSTGIKESAIEDGLIKTDMVADGAITEDKIDKTNITEWTDDEGNKVFDISKFYYGDDKFSVSYDQMVNKVEVLEGQVGSIELIGEQIFKSSQGVITPSSITLTAVVRNGVSIGNWYIDNQINTEYVSSDKSTITIPSTYMTDKDSITIKVENSTGSLYDEQTVYLLTDASGADGQAAISVIITSEQGTVFDEDTSITNTICTCNVYEGVTEITPNSYNWLIKQDDDSSWESVGTSKQITLPINTSIIRTRLKCEVDLDIT